MAQIATRVGQSEMRIGMTTSAFGSVEVRTTVHANDIGLTIGSEKGDLRSLLTNEIPAITNNLQQQNLRLNSVSFTDGSATPQQQHGGGGNSQQQNLAPLSYAGKGSDREARDSAEDLPVRNVAGAAAGLSILA
jgi:flagellar hook-length control protein FliK